MKTRRKLPLESLTHVARGVMMGGADIVPGVSGGTVALVLGIYERLVLAISHFDLTFAGHVRRREWGRAAAHVDLAFLIALGCGILTGIACLASLMNYLLEQQPQPTLAAFFGLIVASSVIVARTIPRWNWVDALLAVSAVRFGYWLVGLPFLKEPPKDHGYLFLCGMIAICAMILPGISGAFILLILGPYERVTGVLRQLLGGDIASDAVLTLVVFGVGCAVGLLSFSKFLRWLLARWHNPTMATLCGFMIGSLRKIWPFKEHPTAETVDLQHKQYDNAWPEAFDGDVVLAIALAVGGMVLVLGLDAMTRRYQQPDDSSTAENK